MASYPQALIYGQVAELRIYDSSMSILLLVFGPKGYTRYIWVQCNKFRGIVKGEFLRINGTFDGDILAPGFWYDGGKSDVTIRSVSAETAKTSYCSFTLDCKIMSVGCNRNCYYYYVSYFSPKYERYQDDENHWHEHYTKFKTFQFALQGDAVRGFYQHDIGDRAWLRFRGEFAPNNEFLVSKID